MLELRGAEASVVLGRSSAFSIVVSAYLCALVCPEVSAFSFSLRSVPDCCCVWHVSMLGKTRGISVGRKYCFRGGTGYRGMLAGVAVVGLSFETRVRAGVGAEVKVRDGVGVRSGVGMKYSFAIFGCRGILDETNHSDDDDDDHGNDSET